MEEIIKRLIENMDAALADMKVSPSIETYTYYEGKAAAYEHAIELVRKIQAVQWGN